MTPATTTSITSRHLVALLDEARAPIDDLLAAAALDRAAFDAPDFALPLPVFGELWRRAARVRPDIGVAMVDRFGPGQMHVLAHLAMRSPTVGRALEDVSRYAAVTTSADRLDLSVQGDRAQFSASGGDPANPWIVEHYLSMALVFLTRATGRTLPLRAVRFRHARHAPLDAYQARFGIAPAFGWDGNALELDAAALEWQLQTRDDYLHTVLEDVARARGAPPPESLLQLVRREIATIVVRGETPTIADVGERCGLGARALRARLAGEGVGFRALLDDVRRDLARGHLARGMSVTEAAYLLGFSEPAAFQHACQRWFGVPAGRVRETLG